MAQLKVGVAGLGQGYAHARVLHQHIPETEVVILCDLNEERSRQRAQELGISRTTTHLEDLLRDPELDIICIAIGCPWHGQATIAALEAGKHVLVEVPAVSLSLDEVWRMVWAAERGRLKLQMGNHVRWWPAPRTMKKMVAEGKVGQPFYGEGEYWHDGVHGGKGYLQITAEGVPTSDAPHWRLGFGNPAQETIAGGGGTHALDTIRWILGEEFAEVTAYGNRLRVPYRAADDFQVALFRAPSSAIARVAVSYAMIRPSSIGVASVYGTEGSLEIDRYARKLWYAGDLNNPEKPLEEVPVIDVPLSKEQREQAGHGGYPLLQDRDLVEAILADRQPEINVYEAARSCAAAICALQSVREGRPIRIPSFPQRMT